MADWDYRFLGLADHVAKWSKDPSTKVGAVVVDRQRRVVSMGYNGFPRGVADRDDWYENRVKKYAMVIHAEANAILNATTSLQGCTCYVTHPCCSNCAGMLIQAGVKRVLWRNPSEDFMTRFSESVLQSIDMFAMAGVKYQTLADRSSNAATH
jgi:dCMP deaminase